MNVLLNTLNNARHELLGAIKEDGGIDTCDIGLRTELEQVDAAITTLHPINPSYVEALQHSLDTPDANSSAQRDLWHTAARTLLALTFPPTRA